MEPVEVDVLIPPVFNDARMINHFTVLIFHVRPQIPENSGKDNLAAILTQTLLRDSFEALRKRLGMVRLTDLNHV